MMRLLAILILLLGASPAMAQLLTTPSEVMRGAVTNVIRPAMADFAAEAHDLSAAMDALCATPSATTVEAANAAFAATALGFGAIEAIRVGPLVEENRTERLLFWPDRKGIALKQVQAILANEDQSALDSETLKGKSVAVQGLTALEFALYGTGSEALQGTDGAFRCAYGRTVAQSIAGIADELVAGWDAEDGIAFHLTHPSAEFADYRTPIEAQEELVGTLAHGIEAVRDTRINPILAKDGAAAKPKLALFWRSGLTVPMMQANIDGLRTLFTRSGIKDGVIAEQADLPVAILAGFDEADAALDRVTTPIETALADPAQAQALADVVVATQKLGMLIGEQFSAALGLSVGFSALDRD